jgi:hypothetical protein
LQSICRRRDCLRHRWLYPPTLSRPFPFLPPLCGLSETRDGVSLVVHGLRVRGGAPQAAFTSCGFAHRRITLNALAREVPGANYKTHGERQAAAAVVRRAERRHARERAKQRAVDEMRRAEQRALHERRKAAEAAADLIRRRGALAYAEAARLDSATLTQDYRVKLPWAMWPKEADSERYELYEIAEMDTECQYVVLERTGASYAERRRPIRKGARPHWNRFAVDWDCFTGVRRYGTNQRGVVIVHAPPHRVRP